MEYFWLDTAVLAIVKESVTPSERVLALITGLSETLGVLIGDKTDSSSFVPTMSDLKIHLLVPV